MTSLLVRDDGVAVLTLNRAPVNALDPDLVHGLLGMIRTVASDARAHALVIASALPCFCAGADLRWVQGAAAEGRPIGEFTALMNGLFDTVADLPIPTIAALDGAALGGGLELALACDLRVLGEDASIGFPEAKVGLYPAGGGLPRLAAIAGRAVALDLALTGRRVDSAEAARRGVAQYVCPTGTAEEHAADIARELARLPRAALAAVKQRMGAGIPTVATEPEVRLMAELFDQPEARAALTAFGSR